MQFNNILTHQGFVDPGWLARFCGVLLASTSLPAQEICEPLPDRSGCTAAPCFDGDLTCRPTAVIHDPDSGQITVKSCDCLGEEDCYLDPSVPLASICQGQHCPKQPGSGCHPAVAANDDGTDTIFCCAPPPCDVDPGANSCTGTCLNANRECKPVASVYDPVTGQDSITDCDCVRVDDCALSPQDGAPPVCDGLYCEASVDLCELAGVHNQDGTIEYTCCACLQPPEACCLPFFQCQDVAPLCCPDQGGFPAGSGTLCTAPEECCFSDGSNQIQDPACCILAGGLPQGAGTGDSSLAPGACCLPSGSTLGSCVQINPHCCAELGGMFHGPLTLCLGDPDQTGVDDACECQQAPPGMVGWWTLDEVTGLTAFDSSGYANDGTHINGFTPTLGVVAGAQAFNGALGGNSVSVPHSAALDPAAGPFSIDLWLQPDVSYGSGNLVQKFDTTTLSGYIFSLNSAGEIALLLARNAVKCMETSVGAGIASGQWVHAAVTVSACTSGLRHVQFYVNGQFNSGYFTCCAGPLSSSLSNSFPLLIGSNGNQSFGGDLDEVEVFNVELPPSTILEIYQAGDFGKCKCVPLRDGSGCTNPVCPISDKLCVPTIEHIDAISGQLSVLRCGCVGANECQLAPSSAGPGCAGPSGVDCALVGTDTDGDGVLDEFSCSPIPPAIPTTSEWGVVVLVISILSLAKVCFSRRELNPSQ